VSDPNPAPLTGNALAVEIISRMRDGQRRFDIRLDPPELGRIEVRLDVDRHGQVTTRLTVDRPETLELMQREARGLERALQQAGLKTDEGGLQFSLRQHAENYGQGQHEGRERSADLAMSDDSELPGNLIDGYRASILARSGVDIRV
jgi:chemotaxis protein MotD